MKKPEQIAKIFSPQRILIAIIIGLMVSIYMIFKDFSFEKYRNIHWTIHSIMFFGLALILMAMRYLAYMYRIRVLTDNEIGWKYSFQVISLWEFASALTPSVVGGSAAALFFVTKELKSAGKATAIVMITALLDELFYIFMVPVIILIVGLKPLFIYANFYLFGDLLLPTKFIFWVGYGFILLLTSIITFAIFFRPNYFKRLLMRVFHFPILKRWQKQAIITGNEIIITSSEMKGKPIMFWFKAYGATLVTWTARFFVVNMLIMAFTGVGDQLLIYGRQLVMWVILLISPTPGGSGVAEYILPKFVGEFMNGYGDVIALLWRLLSYYSYLILGALVLPVWLRRIYKNHL